MTDMTVVSGLDYIRTDWAGRRLSKERQHLWVHQQAHVAATDVHARRIQLAARAQPLDGGAHAVLQRVELSAPGTPQHEEAHMLSLW